MTIGTSWHDLKHQWSDVLRMNFVLLFLSVCVQYMQMERPEMINLFPKQLIIFHNEAQEYLSKDKKQNKKPKNPNKQQQQNLPALNKVCSVHL